MNDDCSLTYRPSPATRKGVFRCLTASAVTLLLFWITIAFG